MADIVERKIKLLSLIRLNPDRLLPVVDNLGWDAGLLAPDRPYFLEAWATCGITMLTYFVSARGIEDASTEDLVRMLTEAKLFRLLDPEKPRTSVMKFEDSTGEEFFSINVVVGDEEGLYLEGGRFYSYGPLNEYNSRKLKEAEENGQ